MLQYAAFANRGPLNLIAIPYWDAACLLVDKLRTEPRLGSHSPQLAMPL
jgi:hypothetical protein